MERQLERSTAPDSHQTCHSYAMFQVGREDGYELAFLQKDDKTNCLRHFNFYLQQCKVLDLPSEHINKVPRLLRRRKMSTNQSPIVYEALHKQLESLCNMISRE